MPSVTRLHVNGETRAIDVDESRSLLSVLRDDLDLTGTKYGCGEGQCGACTVLIGGAPARSCITTVGEVGERQVATIESLADGERLHPLQQAFLDAGALQCGYCTPGMLMSGVALLEKNDRPSEEDILHALNGNICRCGTYRRIMAAIEQAGEVLRRADR